MQNNGILKKLFLVPSVSGELNGDQEEFPKFLKAKYTQQCIWIQQSMITT